MLAALPLALVLCCVSAAGAQDAQPSLPVAPPPAPAIQTATPAPKQLPVADALSLPFAPEPQHPSAYLTQQLATAKPLPLAHGTTTPSATATPLRLSLDDAVRLGLEHNLNIGIDQQQARQVNGLQLNALNALIPTLSFRGQTSTQQVNLAARGFNPSLVQSLLPPGAPPIQTIVKYDVTSAQINLNQQLFNLPAFEIYKAAKIQSTISNLNSLSDRAQIVQNVATDYLRVLADEASVRNAESQLVSDRELERQSGARKQAGTGTNLDYIRSQVTRQQRQQQQVSDRNNFEKDKLRLNRDMGLAADQPLELIDPVPYHELAGLPLATAKQVAYLRRKDLLSLQAQLRSAELQRKAIRYERLPAATLSGFYGVIGQTHGLYHGDFIAQGGLNVPLFLEARIRGDRDVAEAQLLQLRSQIASLREDIEAQIRGAMLDVNTSNDLVKAASSNVDLSAEALGDAQLRYRAGVDDNLAVVQAEATLANAQNQLVSALFQFNGAKLQLARYTGVLESQYDSYLNE